ncbi:ATP-dependent nuclease [Phaeobacter inhibens]|uniref:ATP-dependent nuclease n=1 Tax=Phaeobacter inhibens TaxID=221822 RepID=UPI0021A6A75D|nr:ATP-binding protein [Phaeobacter inhibens]UWR45373.1 ATP-binding protein [Phaeobacter inhibens]
MKLVSFSVENFRSITTARKIPLSSYSLLVGANNEGKSNILHALTIAMNALVDWHRQVKRTSDGRVIRSNPTTLRRINRNGGFDWATDYPIGKQAKATKNSKTNIILEFELSEEEIDAFRNDIKSSLNGTLPLLVSFGKNDVEVTVKKPGRGQASLTKKSTRIANFVSERIRFEYIPAIRTAQSAERVISNLVGRELAQLEDNPEYSEALRKIDELQAPIFQILSDTIQTTVSNFLPSVKSVDLKVQKEARYRSLRRDVEIIVDDGQLTPLKRKGDGVQSLVALALMRHASDQNTSNLSTVVAIEEPESHLHPHAVHELRSVIEALSEKNQIVLTSHSPLFVDPRNLKNTVIVRASKAVCATHVQQVREALGVRFSDNLENARVVLLVEGSDDALALHSILRERSDVIDEGIKNGLITIDHLGGASALRSKASFYTVGACMVQCFIDDDAAGRAGAKRAVDDKALKIRDINLCSVPSLEESEIEDLYDKNIYADSFKSQFGVNPKMKVMGKKRQKWSSVVERQFTQSGKPWNDETKLEVKNWMARFAADHPKEIINEALSGPLDSFIETIESKLPTD